MSNLINSLEYYDVPYNGTIAIKETFTLRKGRKIFQSRYVTWFKDEVGLRVDREGRVNHQVSKVRLLKAIYRAGDLVVGMSKRRLDVQSHRFVEPFDMRPKTVCLW